MLALGAGIEVSRIGLGGGRISGCADDASAATLLRRALDLGVNLIDTADIYGRGLSEARIAKALRPYPAGLVIATKGGFVPGPGGPVRDGSPRHLRAACEGKVRRVGLSNVDADQLALARSLLPVAAVQNAYNVRRRRRFGPDPVLAACGRAAIPFLAAQPLALGRLAQADEVARRVAARHGASPGQVALAWLLGQSGVTLQIPGTTTVCHLEENVPRRSCGSLTRTMAELERPPAGRTQRRPKLPAVLSPCPMCRDTQGLTFAWTVMGPRRPCACRVSSTSSAQSGWTLASMNSLATRPVSS